MSMFVSVVLEDGEIPDSASGGPGIAKSLVHMMDDLDAMAVDLGLRPLGDFVVDYGEQMEELFADEGVEDIDEALSRIGADGPWFDPDEGLRTVGGLIQRVEGFGGEGSKTREGTLIVLGSIASELEYAKKQGSRFHLGFGE